MFFGEPFGGLLPGARGAVLSVLLRTGAPMTGRQVHGLVSDRHSLSPIQEALKVLTQLGIVRTETVGRAGVHTINEDHYAVPHLRALADPITTLRAVIEGAVSSEVECVMVFGSIARGEASASSDIDLAVIAAAGWDGRVELEDAVGTGLGNHCDVLVFTRTGFAKLARAGEPIVHDVLRDGIALVGTKPRPKTGAA
jgi:predicted nucleotidyltransferase